MTLHAQIAARIDELTAIALNVAPGPWFVSDPNEGSGHNPLWTVVNEEFLTPSGDDDEPWIAVEVHTGGRVEAEHIAAWDGSAVLRGLAEDRDILARHAVCDDFNCGGEGGDCHTCHDEFHPCPEIQSLARRHGLEVVDRG